MNDLFRPLRADKALVAIVQLSAVSDSEEALLNTVNLLLYYVACLHCHYYVHTASPREHEDRNRLVTTGLRSNRYNLFSSTHCCLLWLKLCIILFPAMASSHGNERLPITASEVNHLFHVFG